MLNELEKQIVRELQDGLPLVPRPFMAIAEKLNISEEELLVKVKDFMERGVIRRFGAAVKHQELGFVANAMVVWNVPEKRIDEIGQRLATFEEVSHCYHRPNRPGWPYTLFTVVHGTNPQECREVAARLSQNVGIDDYQMLFSTAELKKSSMKYFV